jgi:transcriptional regulator with XRE-family HTH domain
MTEMEWLNIFGDNLVSILEEYRMSQRELADAAGLSESTVSQYIHKQRIPNLKAIINIADALDMSIDDLINFGDRIW